VLEVLGCIKGIENDPLELPLSFENIDTPDKLIETLNIIGLPQAEIDEVKKYKNDLSFKEILRNKANEYKAVFPDYIRSIQVLLALGLLVNGHVTTTRYPDSDKMKNPSFIYDLKSPLVTALPSLHDILDRCLGRLSSFYIVDQKSL